MIANFYQHYFLFLSDDSFREEARAKTSLIHNFCLMFVVWLHVKYINYVKSPEIY